MQAGTLDNRIVIKQFTSSQDAYGQKTGTWVTLTTIWAGIKYDNADEIYEANQKKSIIKATFITRYNSTIKVNMRIYFDDLIYQIVGIKKIGRKKELEILAIEKDNLT